MSSHLLSVDSLSRDDVDHLMRVSALMEPIAQRRKVTRVVAAGSRDGQWWRRR